jgi:hypothetical protein
MKILYLDESGTTTWSRSSGTTPLFVLGGVIVEREYARTVLDRPSHKDWTIVEDKLRRRNQAYLGRGSWCSLARNKMEARDRYAAPNLHVAMCHGGQVLPTTTHVALGGPPWWPKTPEPSVKMATADDEEVR